MQDNTQASPDALETLRDSFSDSFRGAFQQWLGQRESARSVGDIAWRHAEQLGREMRRQADAIEQRARADADTVRKQAVRGPWQWSLDLAEYLTDAAQRQAVVFDTLRRRGNTFVEHEAAGMPPVLDFEYDVIVDGHTLARPVNYSLLRIRPPEGVTVDATKRPFMIVDPRAGHGAGIGGFKPESQVGEAFADGHPVYFVVFRPVPEPGQTLADVRDAEIGFLREIIARHPQSPRPAVIGNCQGGWATMVLAASAPDLVGPVVINGAPMSYWAGKVGQNPMRYAGGLGGGAVPALLMSDLGAGVFDGSSLVMNFENLNPANSLFKKYYNLYANVDTEAERFLEFERWWGGFFLMNEEEIRWIVENLFIGNRLARGEAELGGERIDLRRIETPIIVFASQGDNITPPQQALNWIADLYRNVDEIKARGQRIVYMVHKSIGHLGIFVSAKISAREHDAITDTMRAVEALAPGLYEMVLADGDDRLHIRYEPRSIDDILALDDGRDDEELFASVARLSEMATETYDQTVRPLLRAVVTPEVAGKLREMSPLRTRLVAWSDRNPMMAMIETWADQARAQRRPAANDNPFTLLEKLGAEMLESQLNLYRDARDGMKETIFHAIYGAPAMKRLGRSEMNKTEAQHDRDLRSLPEVQAALATMSVGGAGEGTVRMLCLLAKARGYERRSTLEREVAAFRRTPSLMGLDEHALAALVHQQSLVVDFEPDQALSTLPLLLDTSDERRDALAALIDIAGPRDEMHPAARVLFQRFETMLGVTAPEPEAASAAPAAPQPAIATPAVQAVEEFIAVAATPAATDAPPTTVPYVADITEPLIDITDGSTVVARAPVIAPSDEPADDLEAVRGIGPRMAVKLRELGFERFAQLAALDAGEIAWLDLKLEARGRVQREGWIDQARELAVAPAGKESAA